MAEHCTFIADHRLAVPLMGIGLFLAAIYVRSAIQWRKRTRGVPLPPGPRPLPVIGNLLDLPQADAHLAYREMAVKYGDVMYMRVLGQDIVILSSLKDTIELFEKRSANYSNRPCSGLEVLVGFQYLFGFMPYGQVWREHRRMLWQQVNPNAVTRFQPSQRAEVHKLLRRLLDDPGNAHLKEDIAMTFGALLLRSVYGIEVTNRQDGHLGMIHCAIDALGRGLQQCTWLAEYLPIVDRIPQWLPGTSTQRQFAVWRAATTWMKDELFAEAKGIISRIKNAGGEVPPILVNTLLDNLAQSKVDPAEARRQEIIIKQVSATVLGGGLDTSESVLQTFLIAMTLYPDVQRKAQAALDLAVGADRLVSHDDRAALPYLDAVLKEVLRWQPVVPIGLAHTPMADDEFRGHFIPAGAVVIPNSWAFLHDPEVYPDPLSFVPERFLKDGELDPAVRDPATIAFGFGRRICPGRHLADSTSWIAMAMILQVFDVSPPVDKLGKPIYIEPKMKPGLVVCPEDCRCILKPRSAAAEALIRANVE